MKSQNTSKAESPFLYKRFQQIVLFSQIGFILGALNALSFGAESIFADNFIGLKLDAAVMIFGAIIISIVYALTKMGKLTLAGSVYVWLCTVVMAYITWLEGGLYSLAVVTFPLILLFGALFTKRRVFASILVTILGVLVLLGLNHIHDWYPSPPELMVHGYSRMIGGLIVTALCGIVAWIVGEDMKSSVSKLEYENQRVLDSQKVIRNLAEIDSVTGLYNRNAAKEKYRQQLSEISPGVDQLVFYFIDLDNFKSINDLFDHHAGDQLLATIGDRLKALIKEKGIAARLGGDEFVVYMTVPRDYDFDAFAKSLINAVAQPHFIFGAEAEVTASIGIAMVTDRYMSFDFVRKRADMAMYKAKQSGKNQYHHYSDKLNKEYMRNLNIVTGLKDSLSHNLLDLHFQPKVSLGSNKVGGAEALIRWNRGNPQLIRPDEFIPIIESTELIHDIGAWVIQEACRRCKEWHDLGYPIHVAVNVSAIQLTRASFYGVVLGALRAVNLDPVYLEIELTEHLLIQENKLVKKQLTQLKALGVSLSIDDFGTGYSNMNYLTRLQVDALKLDRSFISQISHSEESLVIVTAIIRMAKVLGMKVVAEGIEQDAEKRLLLDLDCDYGQGFYWSKALPQDEFIRYLVSSTAKHSLEQAKRA